jgi:uncharacterized protein (DUF169 family)
MELGVLYERLNALVGLEHKPVVLAFSSDAPKGVEQYSGVARACEFVDICQKEQRAFYTTADNQSCRNGNYYLGLSEPFSGLTTGEHNAGECGRALVSSPGAFRRLLSGYAIIPTGTVTVISYAPIDAVPFSERFGSQVIVVTAQPGKCMLLLRGANYRTGHTIPGLTGPSTCSSVYAAPILRGEVHYSLGCFGLRLFTEVRDDELVVGVPREEFAEVVGGVERFIKGRAELASANAK